MAWAKIRRQWRNGGSGPCLYMTWKQQWTASTRLTLTKLRHAAGNPSKDKPLVRRNFEKLLRDLPDLTARISRTVSDGDEVWMEWGMHGTRRDGTILEFVGVNIFQVLDGRFRSGRIYTEIVRDAGGIEAQIDRMTKGAP